MRLLNLNHNIINAMISTLEQENLEWVNKSYFDGTREYFARDYGKLVRIVEGLSAFYKKQDDSLVFWSFIIEDATIRDLFCSIEWEEIPIRELYSRVNEG